MSDLKDYKIETVLKTANVFCERELSGYNGTVLNSRKDMLIDFGKKLMRELANEADEPVGEALNLAGIINCKPDIKAVLNASVSAIYFSDNSDYKSYHYEIINRLTGMDDPSNKDIFDLYKKLNM